MLLKFNTNWSQNQPHLIASLPLQSNGSHQDISNIFFIIDNVLDFL